MPSAFRNDGHVRPLHYRTPSPPSSASPSPPTSPGVGVEAPAYQQSVNEHSRHTSTHSILHPANHDHGSRRQSPLSQDAMDTFASIALSTTSGWLSHGKHNTFATPPSKYTRQFSETSERPAKRARSEKIPSPAWVRGQSSAASRPATSYETIPESMIVEAELLMNFCQVARVAMPSHVATYKSIAPERGYPNTIPSQAGEASARPLRHNEPIWLGADGIAPQTGRSWGLIAQESSQPNINVQEPTISIPAINARETLTPEIPSLDFREQLIEASKSAQHQLHPSEAAEDKYPTTILHQAQPTKIDSEIVAEVSHMDGTRTLQNQGSAVAELKAYTKDVTVQPSDDSDINAHQSMQKRIQHLPTTQEIQSPAIGYWPSILANTVEQSASAWKNRLTQALEELGTKARQLELASGGQSGSAFMTAKGAHAQEPATCAACRFMRNSMNLEIDGESASWISCDGCKSWFHFACAGFKSEREVRAVDKYRCKSCKPVHGPTTYVRKSSRAHTAIDYAGLNQGVVKTSDERPEHHYIKPIKEGTISLQPENFARMRPELLTAEYFEKGNGMKEPVVIPADWNPRPRPVGPFDSSLDAAYQNQSPTALLEDWFARDPECRNVPDHGQDALDMVIPPDLTVRKVAELYGPEEKVEVIDVKSQNGEGKKWNMRRWADYYESTTNKVVRNVISLEVSQSTLGRMIRRPQIVRDLDLQDSVWPAELQAKGEFPRVQFYCLMSVADCFTDFHIDFGGSSVFYHILKGKKTFFFIPPKEKHLKKYEEWCMSPAQNWTFLADQTKECYRVDLSEGDTMLIPAGWIHAVWTPEDSLVIGGNFLTRLNYSMQLQIAQIEKATGVARKFRYPHFQRIQWYTALRYLEQDPLPSKVRSDLQGGEVFHRQHPAYHDFNAWGENSRSGPENYHARYYSQPELEGLPDLIRYLLRTALIDSGDITEGITAEARNAIKKSIPRGFGEPLEIVKHFAVWCAWKRGNESIPHWAYPDAVPEIRRTDGAAKLSAASLKKLDRETASQAPCRHSSRNQLQQPLNFAREGELQSNIPGSPNVFGSLPNGSLGPHMTPLTSESQQQSQSSISASTRKRKMAPGDAPTSHRKTACESCRKRRRACKHKTDQQPQNQATIPFIPSVGGNQPDPPGASAAVEQVPPQVHIVQHVDDQMDQSNVNHGPETQQQAFPVFDHTDSTNPLRSGAETALGTNPADDVVRDPPQDMNLDDSLLATREERGTPKPHKVPRQKSLTSPRSQPRSKACNDCRKSKRRCVHDENGNEDPVKVREAATPRSAGANKRRKIERDTQNIVVAQHRYDTPTQGSTFESDYSPNLSALPVYEDIWQRAPATVMVEEGPRNNVEMYDQPATFTGTDHSQAPLPVTDTTEPTQAQSLLSTAGTATEITNLIPPSGPDQKANETQVNAQKSTEALGPNEQENQAITLTPPKLPKYHHSTQLSNTTTFDEPAASSLVSPPESSHEGESEQPVPPTDPTKPTTCSESSSRHSSRHPTQAQRFTPESGLARRDSSSSMLVRENTSPAEVIKLPTTSPISGQAPDPAQKRMMKARLGSEVEADEESLKLIKALQAEDYGLRRRGRA